MMTKWNLIDIANKILKVGNSVIFFSELKEGLFQKKEGPREVPFLVLPFFYWTWLLSIWRQAQVCQVLPKVSMLHQVYSHLLYSSRVLPIVTKALYSKVGIDAEEEVTKHCIEAAVQHLNRFTIWWELATLL